ncbi:hypothetical protein JB92DRAFT_3106540 [Gautieria morchelliformis]|nr:hypothetical protein JB92DRAFT_3106540 [Gautieria morchelliformis]
MFALLFHSILQRPLANTPGKSQLQHPLNQQTPSNYRSTIPNDTLDTDINNTLLNGMAFGDLETFSLDHNFPLSSNLSPDMFSNHPGFALDNSQPSNYAGVTGSNTMADHINITVDDSRCPPSAGESQITAWHSSIQHEIEELTAAPQPSARPSVPTEAQQSAPVIRGKPMKRRGDLATKLKAVHARLNPSPQPSQRTLSPAPSTTSSSPAISSIIPPSYPASPAPTIADSPDENITWDGKTLSSAPPPMRSQLVAGDVIFKSNLVLEHMFPEEICNTSMIIPANEHVQQYKPARTGQFNHPSLETAVLHIAFTAATSLAAASSHSFCPVPLPVIGFACVAIHYSLDVEVATLDPSNRGKAPTLEAKAYGSHYTTYMDSLRVFSLSHPDDCIALQKRLWDNVAAGIPLNAVDNYVSFDDEESLEDFTRTMAAVHTTATSST